METVSPQARKLRVNISEEEWTIHWNKLRLYAKRRFGWLEGMQGLKLDELVSQAIVDTMEGTRRWPPIDRKTGRVKTEKEVPLFPFLCEVLRSLVSHEWERIKKTISFESSETAYLSGEAHLRSLERLFTDDSSGYPYLILPESSESQAIGKDLEARVYELIKDDEDLPSILKLRYAGFKPQAVADKLGLSMTAMRAAQKRLRRKVQNLLQEWNNGQK